jgi:hypothetical protein
MKILVPISLWLIALGSFSTPTFAQCQNLFQGHWNWSSHSGLFNRAVGFKLTSNRGDSRYVSYATGTLAAKRDNRNNLSMVFNPDGRQLFSDRQYSINDVVYSCSNEDQRDCQSCVDVSAFMGQPFAATHSDRLGIEVMPNPFDSATLTVTMTLISWGSGRETFTGHCRDNVIFGFVDSTQTIFTLSLFDIP